MNLYYTTYICSECGAEAHLEEGAVYCPYCGRSLYKARSGRRKTVAACKTAAKIMAAVSFTSLVATLALGTAGLFWFTVLSATLTIAALSNAKREAKRHG